MILLAITRVYSVSEHEQPYKKLKKIELFQFAIYFDKNIDFYFFKFLRKANEKDPPLL